MVKRVLASVAIAAVALGGLSGCVLWPPTTTSDDTEYSEQITSVRIDADSGSITITGERGFDGATVRRELRYLGAAGAGDSHHVEDGTLVLEGCGRTCSVNYTVVVPAGIPVGGTTSNGPLTLNNLGGIDVRTSNGAITLSDIDGDIAARSSNGRITGSDLTGGGVEVETSNGAIELRLGTPQDIWAKTSNGRIEVSVPDGSYAVDADTSNGSEEIDIPTDPDGDHRLELHTSNGSITVRPL